MLALRVYLGTSEKSSVLFLVQCKRDLHVESILCRNCPNQAAL